MTFNHLLSFFLFYAFWQYYLILRLWLSTTIYFFRFMHFLARVSKSFESTFLSSNFDQMLPICHIYKYNWLFFNYFFWLLFRFFQIFSTFFRYFSTFFLNLFLTFENPFLLLFSREHRGLTFKSSFSQKVLMHLSFPQTHEPFISWT